MNTFNDIVGHESVKEHLRNSIASGQISHAYLISGPKGSGKNMLADCFAAALVCEDDSSPDPCGFCISCMQADARTHPDIIYVTHEKAGIVVSDIRTQLINDIYIKPYYGNKKIYIVPEADKMNEAAQNALLKTLEEPPEYAVILLLAEGTGSFLQTILSRCVTLNLRPVRSELVTQYLIKNKSLPDYVAKTCAAFSEGAIGKALRYASDESFSELRSEVLKLVKNISNMKQPELMARAEQYASKDNRAATDDFLELLNLWYHDLLVYKSTLSTAHLLFSDEASDIARSASDYSYEKINNIFNAINKVKERLSANVSPEVTMELLLLAMK